MIKQADKRMKAIATAKAPQSGMATPSKVINHGSNAVIATVTVKRIFAAYDAVKEEVHS